MDIEFEDLGATNYNVYVSVQRGTDPFLVTDVDQGKRDCAVSVTPAGPEMLRTTSYDVEEGFATASNIYYILVSADNGSPYEGPLGYQSGGRERTADSYCAK